ncbi:hypothetical protein [Candidatus Mycoplasma haematohominis]|uniref:Uncharacterized protein n=1 Tax=Candidatus Mycoplasma haematohominis TaxID=1494318 RepID=A0A478FQN0_9MOLU|nr:hypothetical protein [Candidatus Mycoplasma haemohominis]GCE63811.1 hypothetical protein MHSWG343_08180 [Candidatus Mycoplasma haemohominis]
MAMVKVVGGICVSVALIGATSLGAVLLLNNGMPEYTTLSSVTSGKYVEEHKDYFVVADGDTNNDWWEWAYRNRYELMDKPANGSKFAGIASGAQGENSLKAKCKDVYTKDKGDINTGTTHEMNKYSEYEVWQYCSLLRKKPKTIQEANKVSTYTTAGMYGKDKAANLIDPDHLDNEDFWNLKHSQFFGWSNKKGAASNGQEATDDKSIFNKLFKTKNSTGKQIKSLCKEAYFKKESDEETPKKDVLRYCSLKGTE